MYESDEEFGTLPVITADHVDLNLSSNKIDPAKLEHLNADQKDALLRCWMSLLMSLLKSQVYAMKVCMRFMLPLTFNLDVLGLTKCLNY